jgi:hypothetical protein
MKKVTIKLFLFFVLGIAFSGCENKSRNETDENTEAISSSENVDAPEPEVVKNTCEICNREFEGLGYEEVSDGVWEPCKEPYQCFVCSPSCGRKHTGNMNNLVEEAERLGGQRNDGRLYETDACTMCKGTGIEKNTAQDVFGGADGRKCPMCDGRGVRSY